ncbi:alkaline phosphatase D family protein [Pseudokineococcus lusitanus]|uniref:Alkaline phosphatase D n=1 Tax=Pseudokineococcus lusitanus TaxID=763993 RepID=A0A3N1HN79_9ACTN|nr:alkaline phosphatase D family protein [Pseudokineococcus lusitanus]ROP43822.1 alkaline phosphatase D [Pseudokineococcus lusitanus]
MTAPRPAAPGALPAALAGLHAPSAPPSRRGLLLGAGAAALAAGSLAAAAPPRALAAAGPVRGYPFTLGVASGDPLPDGVVLWTRLAVDPLAEDGRGGMPDRGVNVRWVVAADERFRRPVRIGSTVARPERGHSVHVEVSGLEPGREYFYRFQALGQVSPTARTRTAPAADAATASLTFAMASCAQYEHGFFTAYRRLAEDEPEVVLHLGDYVYEYRADDYVAPGGNVRDHAGPETTTLAGYRQRHAQYKTDPDLQAAHAVAPWVVVWDDHEVDNNWADEVPESLERDPLPGFLDRRAAAFQAYYENMPLRRSSVPRGLDLQLYRRLGWGRLAQLHMLDTRQYRDDQACGDGTATGCAERLDPARSLPGEEQERWLLDGLSASTATWDVLGQQVFFAQRDFAAGPERRYSMDGWDGYSASRSRLLAGLEERQVANPVVLTGDVHRHYACDVHPDAPGGEGEPDLGRAPVATELVCSSITSGGDGSDTAAATDLQLAENPHIRYASSLRGYVLVDLTPERMTARYRVLDRVQEAGAPARTGATFAVEAGRPGLQPV